MGFLGKKMEGNVQLGFGAVEVAYADFTKVAGVVFV